MSCVTGVWCRIVEVVWCQRCLVKKLVGVKGAQRFPYVVIQLKNFLLLDGEVEERCKASPDDILTWKDTLHHHLTAENFLLWNDVWIHQNTVAVGFPDIQRLFFRCYSRCLLFLVGAEATINSYITASSGIPTCAQFHLWWRTILSRAVEVWQARGWHTSSFIMFVVPDWQIPNNEVHCRHVQNTAEKTCRTFGFKSIHDLF